MSDNSDIDDVAHEELLRSIKKGKGKEKTLRKNVNKVDAKDLLTFVKTERRSLSIAKKKVLDTSKKNQKETGPIAAPIHRQALERIQGEVGFTELKKDLAVWRDVVETNRVADQLQFPLHQERVLKTDSTAMKVDNFKPKTEMEIELAQLVQNSKHNLTNDTIYTPAELEIIKAMNLKEAKEKLASMQKMRALVSYREAKYRYAAKIKSKGYHRLLKRQKRRQLVKEFDELLVRDPEAAKEKLKELETQRVLERGSLRHHARSKFQQEIMKHAGRDPAAKKILEEHLRLGRELKSKVLAESDSDDEEENEKPKSVADLIKTAALAAAADSEPSKLAYEPEDEMAKQKLYEMRAAKRAILAKSKLRADGTLQKAENIFEEEADWSYKNDEEVVNASEADVSLTKSGKKKKKTKRTIQATEEEIAAQKDVDEIFNDGTKVLLDKLRNGVGEESKEAPKKKKKKLEKAIKEETNKPTEPQVDISLDPRHFLQVETSKLNKVSADMDDQINELEDDQSKLVAEAFKDEDVIGEFEDEKEQIAETERGKDIDLTLQGWGSWCGPGTSEKKRRNQFVIKANNKRRKDANKSAVIIKEKTEMPINNLQPRNLPFPYTRVDDYQTVLNQPIGRDYNPGSVTKELCKPAVVTQAGRSIRPLDKKETIKKQMYESDDEN